METLEISTVPDLETVVVAWLERKMVDTNALSMGEVWQELSALLQHVGALRNVSGLLGATAEKNNNVKFGRWTKDVCLVS